MKIRLDTSTVRAGDHKKEGKEAKLKQWPLKLKQPQPKNNPTEKFKDNKIIQRQRPKAVYKALPETTEEDDTLADDIIEDMTVTRTSIAKHAHNLHISLTY